MKFLSFLVMCLFALPSWAGQQNSAQGKWYWNLVFADLNFYPSMIKSVEDIPSEFRIVPIHPDDPGAGGLIKLDPNLSPGSMISWTTGIGKVYQGRKNSFGVNATYTFVLAPYTHGGAWKGGNKREYNYAGYNSGAAYVYYGVKARLRKSLPGANIEYRHQLTPSFLVISGYRFTPYTFELESGWDRYSSLEVYRHGVISNNYLHEPYVGIGYSTLNFTVGPVYQQISNSTLGDKMVVRYSSHIWKAGVSFNIRY